jgi:hypothetical protein
MKNSSNTRRSARTHASKSARAPGDRAAKPKREAGVSRWRALERKTFSALIAFPSRQDRPQGIEIRLMLKGKARLA